MTAVQPQLKSEVDWPGNPSAGYFDQLRYADGLRAYWRLNTGASIADELAAANGVTTGSPSTGTGALPNDTDLALVFNGSSQDGYVADCAAINPAASFSLEGWVKVPSLPSAVRDLAAKRGSYLLQINASNKLAFTVKNDTTVTSVQAGTALTTGTFFHVACVYDATAKTISIYVNGVLDASASHTAGIEVTGHPLRFAASVATASPTYQSSQTASGSGATNLTVNAPASIASGDYLIAQLMINSTSVTLTVPTGWTLIAQADAGSSRTRVYQKIATGSEPASYTWVSSAGVNFAGGVSRITGVDSVAPVSNAYAVGTAIGTSHATGTHLPCSDNNMLLAFFGVAASSTFTESSGTEQYEVTANRSITMCSQTQATAASINVTATSSSSGSPGTAILIVLTGTGLTRTSCTLDDFTFWGVALTSDQAVEHYQARLGGVGSWTDITADVVAVNTRAGRQYEHDRITAGTSITTLDDVGRSYDPSVATNVVPLRKLRHRATVSGTDYALWRGFIERLPQEWQADYEQLAITGTDAFEPFNLADVTGTLAGGLSGAQIHSLLDKAGWPRADRAIDTGKFIMDQVLLAAGTKALGELQTIAESENGVFFIDAAGVATFHDFGHRATSTRSRSSQATFSNANDSNPTFVPELLRPMFDKDRVFNDWTVTTNGGAAATAVDALSISKFFRRSQQRSTRLKFVTDAQQVASALLQETANPALRFDSLTAQPIDAATWITVLGLTISDRITVIRAPSNAGGGATVTKDCFIEGIAWQISVGRPWQVTFQLSPCAPSSYYDTIIRDQPVSYWRMATAA